MQHIEEVKISRTLILVRYSGVYKKFGDLYKESSKNVKKYVVLQGN